MTKDTENLITWGLLAFIAYELWQQRPPAPTLSFMTSNNPLQTNTPKWIQQLSNEERYDYYVDMTNGGIANDITDNLLTIPQGPGGTYIPGIPDDYFSPTAGIFAMCR